MPVFTSSQIDAIHDSIRHTFTEHLDHEECNLTTDDLLKLFVRPEHHEAARLAPALFSYRMYGSNAFQFKHKPYAENHTLVFNFSLNYTYDSATNRNLIPWVPTAYSGSGEFFDTGESYEKFSEYMARVHALYQQYNNMAMLLNALNTRCTSAGQLAFVWPAITQLVEHAAKRGAKVEGIKKMVSRRNNSGSPIVTPMMRELCRETGATLSFLQLVGKAPNRGERCGFQIDVGSEITIIHDKATFNLL